PSPEEKEAAQRAREEKRALVRQVRAERMAAEARLQSEEYVRVRANAAEMGFGSTVSVPTAAPAPPSLPPPAVEPAPSAPLQEGE
ncbi:MAG: hypothetical protein SGPRY_008795, partial [Prymnesium sp.]